MPTEWNELYRRTDSAASRLKRQGRVRCVMVAVAIAAIALAITKYVFIDNRSRDILPATIAALDGHYTVYSKRYGESKFRSIRVEMTVRQVEDIMGPPLEKGPWMVPTGSGPVTVEKGPLDDIWYYTRGGKHVQHDTASHWLRSVYFRNGVVCETDSTYYLD
jgi:hypothetical protein